MKNIKNLYLQLPKQHKVVISALSVTLLLVLFIPSEKATASRSSGDNSFEIGKRYQVNGNNFPIVNSYPEEIYSDITESKNDIDPSKFKQKTSESSDNSVQAEITDTVDLPFNDLTWKTTKVRSGDSLAKIFQREGLSAKTTYLVASAKGDDSGQLKKLNVGDTLELGTNEKGELVSLIYPLSKIKTFYVNLVDDNYQASIEIKDVEIRQGIAHGVIKSSFWNAAITSGMDDGQIINLANVFGWDIDFALDIRAGDSFHVVYETRYVDGEYIGTGDILAAEFINQNESFKAIKFTDGEYYTPEGRSMRKAFLRAPVNFKYISSDFKPKRFHPIQKRWKAHNGTDYRANTGTPVVAAGSGKVTDSTYNKYNGHYVFIQHGDGIVTKYLHFSKRAVKKGDRVKQGQVIGYVGSTGMSEAPHLHYEFLLNGVHRNPRTVKLPDAQPIAKKHQDEFAALSSTRLKELNGSKQALLAMQSSFTNEQ